MILIVVVPIAVYWSDQRIAAHARWDNEVNYAQLFREHMWSAADLINGTFFPWNNESKEIAQTELTYGLTNLNYLGGLDWPHVNQLDTIFGKLENLPSVFYRITNTQRKSLSANLYSLGNKIVFAYFLNNTFTSAGVGPPFWYPGPSPPNERDLQDAVSIAANLTR
jgi:hypothetical protein